MKKKSIPFILCTVLSIGLAALRASKYILIGSSITYGISVFSAVVLFLELMLSIYATTGKSLGLIWSLREYGVRITAFSTASLLCSVFAATTYKNQLTGTAATFLCSLSFLYMAYLFAMQIESVINSFKE